MTQVEVWFWLAYDKVEPIGEELMMLCKVIAAINKDGNWKRYMPDRYKTRPIAWSAADDLAVTRRVREQVGAFAAMMPKAKK